MSERDLAVAKVFSLFLILGGLIVTDVLRCRADDQFTSIRKRIGTLSEEAEMKRTWSQRD